MGPKEQSGLDAFLGSFCLCSHSWWCQHSLLKSHLLLSPCCPSVIAVSPDDMSPGVVTVPYPLLSEKEWLRSSETNFKLKVALKFNLLLSGAQC